MRRSTTTGGTFTQRGEARHKGAAHEAAPLTRLQINIQERGKCRVVFNGERIKVSNEPSRKPS